LVVISTGDSAFCLVSSAQISLITSSFSCTTSGRILFSPSLLSSLSTRPTSSFGQPSTSKTSFYSSSPRWTTQH
jgi:hypothetical protein